MLDCETPREIAAHRRCWVYRRCALWSVAASPLSDILWWPALLFVASAGILLLGSPERNGKAGTGFNEALFKAYEEGKHRRYTLLFAVNGGAFTVVKLLTEEKRTFAGSLDIPHIAAGMILFTAIMCFDILAFGLKMRLAWRNSPSAEKPTSCWDGLFAWPGWLVLGVLWLLISIGWSLASS